MLITFAPAKKNIFKHFLFILFLLVCNISNSQNSEKKWQLNLGTHGVLYRDYYQGVFENMQKTDQINWGWPLSQLTVARHLAVGFSPELQFCVNKVSYLPKTQLTQTFFANGIAMLKYSFSNDYLLGNNSFIEPYLKAGIGMTYKEVVGNKFYTTRSFGGGLAIWPTKNRNLGVQFQVLNNVVEEFPLKQENYFNYSASIGYRFGHKDIDKDGIPDKKDNCPQDFGLKELAGCPDKDGDGIADKFDDCPEVAGLAKFNGCPDIDGDGIPDKDDQCPNEKGKPETKGCPDQDGDGIIDIKDSCIDKPGIAQFFGCPDSDFDSIPDHLDKCPQDKGVLEFDGCPDSDNDGLPNHKDKCPFVAGPIENDGCPIKTLDTSTIVENIMDRIDNKIEFHARSIFFEFGKAVIQKQSHAKLNEISTIMMSYPNSVFYIEGHTDNVGGEAANLILSRRRAQAVKEYLVKRGVDPSNLIAEGYGLKYPLESNNSYEGRAKNRRVDISIKRD